MINLYKEVMESQVSNFLNEHQKETVNELRVQIDVEKDYWKQEVLDSIKEKFNYKIDDLFENRGW